MTPAPRRWLVITSSFPRHNNDLAGHFVEQWCRALAARGHTIDVLCWRGPGAADREICPGLNLKFVPYAPPTMERLFFGAGAPENLTESPFTALLAIPAMAAMTAAALDACRRHRYDAIVGHWLIPGGLLARSIGALTGSPSAIIAHSAGVHLLHNLPDPVGRALARWITSGATTIPTEPLRDKLLALTGPRENEVQIAPMGYAPVMVPDTMLSPLHITKTTTKIGFLGRLVPIKGLPTLMRAIDRLNEAELDISLDVIGDGPCRAGWENEASEAVHFYDKKFGPEKWTALKQWDALAVPSEPLENGRHEGLPVSLLEAASVGTIPLVSGVPGVHSWLASPSDQIVAPGNIGDWCRAIEWLMELDDKTRSALRIRTSDAVASLSWPQYAEFWENWLVSN